MASFNFDLSGMMVYASQLFTSLAPVVALIGGLTLGIGLVSFVIRQLRGLLS